jgi:hypothetical protein
MATPTNCRQVSVSSSGQYQTIITVDDEEPGPIYRSEDYGLSWTLTGAPSAYWSAVSMSESGKYQTACIYNGLIYVSINSGVNWAPASGAPSAYWSAVSMSASGKFQTACVDGGLIYGREKRCVL